MAASALLGLDWGTTSFRAYLIGGDGQVIDRRESAAGILNVSDNDFAGTLMREAGDWLSAHPDIPMLAAGMIGSRQGWHEVPYVACPAGEAELAANLLTRELTDGRSIRFVPGLTVRDAGVPDVMRGEETQIVGVGAADGLFVLPGTHSKWVAVSDSRIAGFATFMTGELFAALRGHTILGRTMSGEAHDAAAFARGLAAGRDDAAARGGLLRRLFGVRTLALFDELPAPAGASYLSGLLIGAELREALASFAAAGRRDTITIIGRGDLADLYHTGLAAAGLASTTAPVDAAANGLWRVARAAGLLEETAS